METGQCPPQKKKKKQASNPTEATYGVFPEGSVSSKSALRYFQRIVLLSYALASHTMCERGPKWQIFTHFPSTYIKSCLVALVSFVPQKLVHWPYLPQRTTSSYSTNTRLFFLPFSQEIQQNRIDHQARSSVSWTVHILYIPLFKVWNMYKNFILDNARPFDSQTWFKLLHYYCLPFSFSALQIVVRTSPTQIRPTMLLIMIKKNKLCDSSQV